MAKNLELYKKSCDILYQAYFNDTLEHQNSCGCAVGNLVAANMGYKYELDEEAEDEFDETRLKWVGLYNGNHTAWYQTIMPSYGKSPQDMYVDLAKEQIDATGYTLEEIIKIEKAFEAAYVYKGNKEEIMFNGLSNVLDVLAKIHEIEDNKEEKERFNKHYLSLQEA